MKETYERTELQVTEFETEDVIMTSTVDANPVTGGTGKRGNDLPFMPNSGGGVYM